MMGVDPIWLGIMIAVNLQTSFLTPPFGFALFYLRGVAPKSVLTSDIYKGVIPFIIMQLFLLILMSVYPKVVTWLPDFLYP
jgi:TRAP-type mannitol/chloroaromatic compound transport system permease large subunit